MSEFYCATCRKYKPQAEKDLSRVKPPRCLGCASRAVRRIDTVKPQVALFDKYAPIVSEKS